MIFKGYDNRTDASDLADGASPDMRNCGHYNDEVGLLGPRKGKTFFNSTKYADLVKGMGIFKLPNGNRRLMLAHDDGTITDNAAPFATETVSEVATTRYYSTGSVIAISSSTANSAVEASADFLGGETYTKSSAEYAIFGHPLVISYSSSNSDDALEVWFGMKTSGGNVYGGFSTFYLEGGIAGSIDCGIGNWETLVDGLSSDGPYTGIAIKAQTTQAGATVSFQVQTPGTVHFR